MTIRALLVCTMTGTTLGCSSAPKDHWLAYGTVEVHEANLGVPTVARVVRMLVDEGDQVHAGDTLALLTQTDLDATLAGFRARVVTAEAGLRDLEAGSREPELARAEAEVASAAAEVQRTQADLARTRELATANLVSTQRFDDAEAAARVAEERRTVTAESLRLLRAGARPDAIAAGRAEVRTARASLQAAEARASDLILTAPGDGTILSRMAQPGEILGAGAPALTLGATKSPWVRAWVPAATVEDLMVGDAVTILVGTSAVAGRIVAINPRAEFTPRVALTEAERADLMFGIKVEPDTFSAILKPGLWVTVRVPRPAGNSS